MIYRRFGYLQARILLYKQDELKSLEHKLEDTDRIDRNLRPELLRSRDAQQSQEIEVAKEYRRELMYEIEQKFKEYGEFRRPVYEEQELTRGMNQPAGLLTTARDLAAFNPPPEYSYKNIKNYYRREIPVIYEDSHIYYKEDLVTLKPGREHSWLDSFVERILQKMASNETIYVSTLVTEEGRKKRFSTDWTTRYSTFSLLPYGSIPPPV